MSAMAEMLVNMVMKELPDELREALKPENLERIKERVAQEYTYFRNGIAHIVQEQQEQRELLEEIKANVGSTGRNRKRLASPEHAAIGDDNGAGCGSNDGSGDSTS